jgi:hypothetical protein
MVRPAQESEKRTNQSGTKNLAKEFVSDYSKEKSAGYVVFVFFPIKAVAWLCRQTKQYLYNSWQCPFKSSLSTPFAQCWRAVATSPPLSLSSWKICGHQLQYPPSPPPPSPPHLRDMTLLEVIWTWRLILLTNDEDLSGVSNFTAQSSRQYLHTHTPPHLHTPTHKIHSWILKDEYSISLCYHS